MAARIRIVIAQAGSDEMDDHTDRTQLDASAASMARALRDAGMEVVYLGPGHGNGQSLNQSLSQTPEQIVRTVIQEDADMLALCFSAGDAGTTSIARTVELLAANEASDVVVFVAGVSTGAQPDPRLDAQRDAQLNAQLDPQPDGPSAVGVAAFFPSDVPVERIVEWVRHTVTAEGEA